MKYPVKYNFGNVLESSCIPGRGKWKIVNKYKKSKVFNIILGISLSVIIYYVNYFSGLLGANGKIPIILSVWLPLVVLILISMIGLVRLNEK